VPPFSLVLHTWTQDQRRHVHVHALLAGGALSSGGEWIRPKKGFLFSVRALSRVFRSKFVAGLAQQTRSERWPAGADWARLKPRLYDHDWVVYAEQPLGGLEAMLEYLGRYYTQPRQLHLFWRDRLAARPHPRHRARIS